MRLGATSRLILNEIDLNPPFKPVLGSASLQLPDGGSGECDSAHTGFDVAVEVGGDAVPIFEMAKHALDHIALPVDGLGGTNSRYCGPRGGVFAPINSPDVAPDAVSQTGGGTFVS